MRRALLDTSVVIDPPRGGEVPPPAEASVSVVTIAELHKGVLVAPDDDERSRRLSQLAGVEAAFEPLAFDLDSARAFGRFMAEAKRDGVRLRIRDALIAATAEARGLPVLTRDRDFERFGVECVIVVD